MNINLLKFFKTRLNKTNSIKTILMLFFGLFLITGCAREVTLQGPINHFTPPNPINSKGFIDITHVTLNSDKKLRSNYFAYQDLLAKNLNQAEGFLGYSRQYTELESWTITIWKNERSLELFLNSKMNKDTITNTFMAIRDIRSSRIELPLKEAIFSWDKAKQILHSQQNGEIIEL